MSSLKRRLIDHATGKRTETVQRVEPLEAPENVFTHVLTRFGHTSADGKTAGVADASISDWWETISCPFPAESVTINWVSFQDGVTTSPTALTAVNTAVLFSNLVEQKMCSITSGDFGERRAKHQHCQIPTNFQAHFRLMVPQTTTSDQATGNGNIVYGLFAFPQNAVLNLEMTFSSKL